ncbi:MAG TPA: lectin-like protein [Polyangiaceae bacterium]|nr:lectin-like protein [Polyangiaceae bacterium]
MKTRNAGGLLALLSVAACAGWASACDGPTAPELFNESAGGVRGGATSSSAGGVSSPSGGSSTDSIGSGTSPSSGGTSLSESGGTGNGGASSGGLSSSETSPNGDGGKTGNSGGGSGAPHSGGAIQSGGRADPGGAPTSGGQPQGSGGLISSGGAGGSAGQDMGGSGGDDCSTPNALRGEERCDGLDNDCDGAIDEGELCPTSCVGLGSSEHSWMLCTQELDFDAAAKLCATAGMHLAWLKSDAANKQAFELIMKHDPELRRVWLGASDSAKEGQWQWVTERAQPGEAFWTGATPAAGGSPVGGAFSGWGAERPGDRSGGDDCAVMVISRAVVEPGLWSDVDCDDGWAALCEP